MVLLEAPGRRLELALYVMPRAVESLWNKMVKEGRVRNIKYGEAMYFSLATGILMSFYQHDADNIPEGLRKIMVRMIGVN